MPVGSPPLAGLYQLIRHKKHEHTFKCPLVRVPDGYIAYYSLCNNCVDHPDNSYKTGNIGTNSFGVKTAKAAVTIPTTSAPNNSVPISDIYWKYGSDSSFTTNQPPAGQPQQPSVVRPTTQSTHPVLPTQQTTTNNPVSNTVQQTTTNNDIWTRIVEALKNLLAMLLMNQSQNPHWRILNRVTMKQAMVRNAM